MGEGSYHTVGAKDVSAAPKILPLSADAISRIHSSKQITSLQGVVIALLENSLDADASKIDLSVNFTRGSCTVEDNGAGIPPSEFHESGGLVRMYHTSKTGLNGRHDIHGSSGTYLASLSALSLMSVTSRYRNEAESATITIHQAKVVARHIPTPPSHELTFLGTSGTRVSVDDLFGNMPVRVKQRVLSSDSRASTDEKAWQELKHGVTALLLAWRSPCSIRIRDARAPGRNLTLSGSHPAVSTALTEKSLNQLLGKPARYDLRDALPVIFQAGFASFDTRTRWVPLSASTIKLSIRGLICLDPAPTRACQFVSFGIHPVSAGSGYSEIYNSINRIFADSSFGVVEGGQGPVDEAEKDRRKRDHRYKVDGYTHKQIRGSKGIDRWPMFVLLIHLKDQPQSLAAMNCTPDQQPKAVIDVLEAMATQWLTAQSFRTRHKRKRKNEQQHSPASAASPALTRDHGAALSRSSARPVISVEDSAFDATSPMKRKRVMDLSGNEVRVEPPSDLVRPSTLDSWSRIKGGRHTGLNYVWQSRKIASAPISQSGCVAEARPTLCKSLRLTVPVLEEGALNRSQRSDTRSTSGEAVEETQQYANHSHQTISSDYFGSVSDADLISAEGQAAVSLEGMQDHIVDWTDPVTGQTFQVNSRTGVVLPSARPRPSTSECTISRASAAINTATTSAGRPLTLARRSNATPQQDDPSVLPEALREWHNPVFARQTEERIAVASLSGPVVELAELAGKRCSHHDETQHFSGIGSNEHSIISKAALTKARVICQVDAKFILCSILDPARVDRGRSQTLVLVDQHAASERVLLERLLAELCTRIDSASPAAQLKTNLGHAAAVQTSILAKPLHFDVSPQEHNLLEIHAAHFARWGILYDQRNIPATEAASSQLRPTKPHYHLCIRALPSGIAERCTLVPKLIIDLLRSEVWALEQSGRRPKHQPVPPISDSQTTVEHTWLNHIGSCPKALLDLLNSRACRSAVMFNDVLSVGECDALLQQLAKCAFPFMCAHGRVSMVPLLELGEGETGMGGFRSGNMMGREVREQGFGEAFKAWKGRV